MADYFDSLEQRDGVRWSWHYYPNKKPGAPIGSGESFLPQDMIVPLGCVLTPLKYIPGMPTRPYAPLRCKQCGACANHLCRIDHASRFWTCPFCLGRNGFASNFQLDPHQLPPEFAEGVGTVEYLLQRARAPPPVFIFILDVAQDPAEFESAKDSISQSLTRLPDDCLVGLVTFGRHVAVWELGDADCTKSVVFRGERADKKATYTVEVVRDYLSVRPPQAGRAPDPAHSVEGRILVPLSDAEQAFSSVLDELSVDPWPKAQSERPGRAVGAALEIATGVAELLNTGQSETRHHGRLLLFLSGPGCRGPGRIVGVDEAETLRTHKDIADGNAPLMEEATEFGRALGARLQHMYFCLDLFICALDQVGVAELAHASVYTGGRIVCSDSFKGVKHDGSRSSTPVFKRSFQKFWERAKADAGAPALPNMFFEVITEVQCSKDTKVIGCIGPMVGRGKKDSTSVHQTLEVGDGKTCAWGTSTMDQETSIALVFDACEDPQGAQPDGRQRYTQFITSYNNCAGEARLRVTTTAQNIAPSADPSQINQVYAFDQLTAAALCGRIASKYMEQRSPPTNFNSTLRWIDRLLIRFVKKFAEYRPNDPNSLRLAQQYTLFPQFLYHLRRSEFLQVFNSSPDETVFFRHLMHRESVQNSVVMMQPSLLSYNYGMSEPEAMMLDSQSVKVDSILFCDAYFDVIVHHGRTIADWRDKEYQKQPEYEAFAAQLDAPHKAVEELIANRFPCPKVTICDQHGSQARYLYNKLNPSDTMRDHVQRDDVQVIHTDDANLQTFMSQLKKLSVQQEQKA